MDVLCVQPAPRLSCACGCVVRTMLRGAALVLLGCASVQALLPAPSISTAPLAVPHKLLHGPGPSTANPRVLASGALPMARLGALACAVRNAHMANEARCAYLLAPALTRPVVVASQLGHMHAEFTQILAGARGTRHTVTPTRCSDKGRPHRHGRLASLRVPDGKQLHPRRVRHRSRRCAACLSRPAASFLAALLK